MTRLDPSHWEQVPQQDSLFHNGSFSILTRLPLIFNFIPIYGGIQTEWSHWCPTSALRLQYRHLTGGSVKFPISFWTCFLTATDKEMNCLVVLFYIYFCPRVVPVFNKAIYKEQPSDSESGLLNLFLSEIQDDIKGHLSQTSPFSLTLHIPCGTHQPSAISSTPDPDPWHLFSFQVSALSVDQPSQFSPDCLQLLA